MHNKQIACELGVVEKTVKVHRARVMEKMRAGLGRRVRAVGRRDLILSSRPSSNLPIRR
jgi:FixJ family two-component response regulator